MTQRSTRLACVLIALVQSAGLPAQEQAPSAPGMRVKLDGIMAQLAESAEHTTMGGRMGYAGGGLPDVINLCRAVHMLGLLPAAERYKVLKQWMLPSAPGALSRYAMCFAPTEAPPEVFFPDGGVAVDTGGASHGRETALARDGVIHFSELIVSAAAECGKLEELAVAAAEACKDSPMGNTLSVLVSLALQRGSQLPPQAAEYVETLRQNAQAGRQSQLEAWPTYLIARAWLQDDRFAPQGEALADLLAAQVSGSDQRSFVSHLHRDLASYRVRQCGGALVPGADPGLALWHPGGYYFTSGNQAGTWPGWWVERDGMIVHLTGPEVSPLYFACPLAGRFELSVDAYCGQADEAAIQYGGAVFEPMARGGKARVLTIGERESQELANPPLVVGAFNRLAIRVSPEKTSYLCNGAVVWEDVRAGSTTPWLALLGRCTRRTAWCNLRLTGDLQIPREVKLVEDDRMDGWMSPLYRENLARQMRPLTTGAQSTGALAPPKQNYVWYAADSVLHGPCTKSTNPNLAVQSWLAYHRPLQSGDTVSYEFFYEQGEKMVHPALGRTALLLEPDGVRLHWITDIPHVSLGGLSPDNAVMIPEAQRGPRPLPLKAGQWNTLVVRMAEQSVTCILNGTEIYEHAVAPAGHRLFGFFRYKNRTAAELRNVVLRGTWPTSLSADQLAHPAARGSSPETRESRLGREALVDDAWFRRLEAMRDNRVPSSPRVGTARPSSTQPIAFHPEDEIDGAVEVQGVPAARGSRCLDPVEVDHLKRVVVGAP